MERKISKTNLIIFCIKNDNIKNKIISGYIEKEIVKEAEIELEEGDETCEAPKQRDMFTLEVKFGFFTFNLYLIRLLIFFKTGLDQLERDLLEVNSNKDALKKNFLELIELRHILLKAGNFFEEVNINNKYFHLSFNRLSKHS